MCLVLQSRINQESRNKLKVALISYDYAWEAFKWHTLALEDQTMQDRINWLIDHDFAADNPYALEIRYHHKCWLKLSEDDKLPYLPYVKLKLSSLTTLGQLYLRNMS